jgi:hypothetical protein
LVAPDYVPPVWPADEGRQRMMMHIDIAVDDLAAAVSDALERDKTVRPGYRQRRQCHVGSPILSPNPSSHRAPGHDASSP